MRFPSTALLASLLFAGPWGGVDAAVRGDYLEVRTADVYTGPCFANSEMNLAGEEAILAWRVREGDWGGVPLAGLSAVAVVRASATLGDPHASPLPVRSVIVVDGKASPEQRAALAYLVRAIGGDLLGETVRVEPAAIEMEIGREAGAATLLAEGVAEVRTRGLRHEDGICGNERVYYPPLTEAESAVPAFTLVHAFRGAGLGGTWSSPGKRSAFVGGFSR